MVRSAGALPDLSLSRGFIDRSGAERRDERLMDRLLTDPATRVLEVRGDRVHVRGAPVEGTHHRHVLDLRAPEPGDLTSLGLFLGRGAGSAAYVAVVSGKQGDAADGWLGLRQAGLTLDDRDAGLFTAALALSNWHGAHTHCPRCGARTRPVQGGWVRLCDNDGSEHYPRTDPAVIMSVVDDEERLLIGRGAYWPEGQFSVLAGFVEPGESFEGAVAREVAEEVGIAVEDVTYLGNQPWPFPSSIMVGFASRAHETDLRLDTSEIAEARWVTRDDYRKALQAKEIRTPSGISIAKRIIELWLGATVESVSAP